jgi:integrin alpha FG-GAP repeat containing protein 1
VYNVVPGDYTQDGRLDLLVMGQGDIDGQLGMSLYVGASDGGFGTVSLRSSSILLF